MVKKKKLGKTKKQTAIVIPPTKIKKTKKCICGVELGLKVRTCKKCGHKFVFKKKKFEEITEWKKLKRDQIFYIRKNGLGPYYQTTEEGKFPVGTKFGF